MANYDVSLIDLLKKQAELKLFSCIRELITEGLHPERLPPGDLSPTRQDVTQFVAAWFRHTGVPQDICEEWMIPYCTERLSAISASSLSQIRHSTKSNIKYIYKSQVPFECAGKNNSLKASCTGTCPLFEEMTEKHQQKMAEQVEMVERQYEPERLDPKAVDAGAPAPGFLKDQYREQFVKAMAFVCDQEGKGIKRKIITDQLNEKGFKTRTGRKWTPAILASELKKAKEKPSDL